MNVNLNIYGKYDMTGVHDREGEPFPRVWDNKRKVWSDSWKTNLSPAELMHYDQMVPIYSQKISDKDHLPAPNTLIDIANFGVQNPWFATNAIAEILNQLYNQDEKHVLISIDQYSDWFRPSDLLSFRYGNDNKYKIPPHHLALVWMFIKFDGHKIWNGFKLCASTNEDLYNSVFEPEMIGFQKGYYVKTRALRLDDVWGFMHLQLITGNLPKKVMEWEIESLYMES